MNNRGTKKKREDLSALGRKSANGKKERGKKRGVILLFNTFQRKCREKTCKPILESN